VRILEKKFVDLMGYYFLEKEGRRFQGEDKGV